MYTNPYRIIFMGTPAFAVPTLQALLDHGENVVGVVTQPDRPKGRGRKLTPPPVKEIAVAASIPVLQPTKIKTQEFHNQLKSLRPDLIVVTAYGRILPGSVLFLPPLGAINIHGSILPKYRGAAPIQWALINGEKETGVTIMQMDEGLDTGDILLPGSIPIALQDTTSTLAVKLAGLGGKLIIEALELLKEDRLPPLKQDDSLATFAPPLKKEDGRINWQKSAFEINCLIRGLDPWPMAFTSIDENWIKLFLPTVVENEVTEPPGTLCRADKNGLLIATGKNYLLIKDVQLHGNRRMDVASFLNGHPLTPGIHFE
jgi:methionyl-tRNA formyltransferase